MYVCICHGVTEKQIRNAVVNGAQSLSELQLQTGCGGTCGQCQPQACQLLFEVAGKPPIPDNALIPAFAGA